MDFWKEINETTKNIEKTMYDIQHAPIVLNCVVTKVYSNDYVDVKIESEIYTHITNKTGKTLEVEDKVRITIPHDNGCECDLCDMFISRKLGIIVISNENLDMYKGRNSDELCIERANLELELSKKNELHKYSNDELVKELNSRIK